MQQVTENRTGYFGDYGGQFVPETLMANLIDLEKAFMESQTDRDFQERYQRELSDYVGRPSPLYLAENLSREWGGKVYLKREDCNHTGAHKINNAIGQALLALKLGKKRVVAETGAGQHGVATAAACARLGLECVVYMGALDCQRQLPNVQRMKLLGAKVRACESGSRNLKVAINEAIRDWIANPEDTHYLIGSVVGPHPYPLMVREFQAMIGREAKVQIIERTGLLPDAVIACVGGGSNAMGIFHDFVNEDVKLYGVEAAGKSGEDTNSAPLHSGSVGVLHGAMQYLLQTPDGQIQGSHSIAPGLDYPGVGPEHSALKDAGRVDYRIANDDEALAAFKECSRLEGIIPALESSHALAFGRQLLSENPGQTIIINLSGRGDKDLPALLEGGLL